MTDGTPDALPAGLYDDVLTLRLERRLAAQDPHPAAERIDDLDRAEAADRLALHIANLIERTIDSLPAEVRVERGSALIRSIGASLAELAPKVGVDDEVPAGEARMLRAVLPKGMDGKPVAIEEPEIPLLDTTLLTNAPTEPSLSRAIISEIASADRIDAIIAFIRFSGIRPLLDALEAHTSAGRPLRILTTTFTNSTQPEALEALARIGAQIRVSYDTGSSRLHAKSWLFDRTSGASTGYVGSSNLSHAGQVVGQEWNVRLSARRNPAAMRKLAAAFEGAWENGDFIAYTPDEFRTAVRRAADLGDSPLVLPLHELRLEPFQERLLEQIEAARRRGRHRNLLVAATGTGKTVMAAVDYARLRQQLQGSRLLFVAHREEILDQARATFRFALREPSFGEKWVGGRTPSDYRHVFASIQSLSAAGLGNIDPQAFDVVIIDEFHHAAATSYTRLLDHLRPQELLGLTATPERADGLPILHWFDDRISAELRLWDAIDQQRLVPFHYFGIHDGLDLTAVPWRRGFGYDPEALSGVYTSNDAWVRTVIKQLRDYVGDVHSMRALGFCVSVAHARFMAQRFTEAGISAVAVTGDTPEAERREALSRLRDGKVNAVFSVDLFNEGVDVPAVDTVLMLRPTESATVFLQQLGRGLRRARGKSVCTVLDFIGQHRREFRFDVRYRALLRLSRADLVAGLANGLPFLPSGCSFQLDRVARDVVLDSIRQAIPSNWPQRVAELRRLNADGYPATLAAYLHETGLDLDDVYANGRSWSDLLEGAGLPTQAPGPFEKQLRRALGRMLHVDDEERIDTYRAFLDVGGLPTVQGARDRRLLRMFVVSLAGQVLGDRSLAEGVALVWRHPQVLRELAELLPLLSERHDHVHADLPGRPDCPLQIHARYTREEVLAAMNQGDRAAVPTWREGVRWAASEKADLFLVTLNKSSGSFSPTTQYRDYAISPTLFHWESQSTTPAGSPTGQRYQRHEAEGSEILIFARMTNASSDRAFWFLGPARYVKHEGERPMAITWRLDFALPGDLYSAFSAAAVA